MLKIVVRSPRLPLKVVWQPWVPTSDTLAMECIEGCRYALIPGRFESSDLPFGALFSCAPRAWHARPNACTARQNHGIAWLKAVLNACSGFLRDQRRTE